MEKPAFDQSYANRVLVLFSLLAGFVLYVDIMLTPSLPSIASDYKVTIAEVSLVISLYTVFGTAVNPVIGKLGDIMGKKRILIYVLIIYCVMVAATSFASSFTVLLITRTVQGIGLGIFPLAFSLVREEFPREMVPRAQGILERDVRCWSRSRAPHRRLGRELLRLADELPHRAPVHSRPDNPDLLHREGVLGYKSQREARHCGRSLARRDHGCNRVWPLRGIYLGLDLSPGVGTHLRWCRTPAPTCLLRAESA